MSDTHSKTHAEAHAGEGHAAVHVVPLRVLLLVWGALMALTWATVSATFIDLGNLNIVIALSIAVVKSAFVVLYFMHLRYDNPFNAFIFMTSVVFVMLFIGFALIDRKEYAPELIPGYAPAMEEARAAADAKATTTSAAATPAIPIATPAIPTGTPAIPTGTPATAPGSVPDSGATPASPHPTPSGN
jgi:cytochrome c oxidase subunit 4